MCKLFLIPALICVWAFNMAHAQIAGINTLSVLDMPVSARSAGLGIDYLSLYSNDINVAVDNPSMIYRCPDNSLSFNYVNMFGGGNFASIHYGFSTKRMGSFVAGMRYLGYGSFEGYDEFEQPIGEFTASDLVFSVGWCMAIDSNYSLGANLKPVFSKYESYEALALALDVAASYVSDSRRFVATIMARNVGAQVMTFDNSVEKIPFEVSVSCSYKLQNAPFRFFFSAVELQHWNLRYEDPFNPWTQYDPFSGETTTIGKAEAFADNLARHLQVGVELNLGKALFVRVGYDYRQGREMAAVNSLNTSGFSFGLGFSVKGFDFAYARNNYHLGQAPNFISITTSLNRFFK